MNLDPRKSYTAKLAFGVLAVLLLSGIVGAYAVVDTVSQVQDEQLQSIGGQADVQDDLVDTFVGELQENNRQLTAEISAISGNGSGGEQRAAIQSALASEVSSSERVLAAHYVDANGTIVASSERDLPGQRLEVVGYTLPNTLDEEGPTLKFAARPDSDAWVIFSTTESGQFVVREIDPTVVADEIDPIVEGTQTRIVNGDGVVVLDTANASAVGTQHVAGSGVDSPAVEAGLDGGENQTVLSPAQTDAAGERVVGYDQIDGGWALISYTSTENAFETALSVRNDVLLLIGVIALALGGFVLVVERPALRSIRDLADAATTLREGDLDTTIETDRRDEFGTVFGALDEMRVDLRDRIDEAESARAEIEQAQERTERARAQAEEARDEAEALSSHLERKATNYGTVVEDVAAGDLTARVDPESDHEAVSELGRTLNEVLAEFERTVADVQSFTAAVADRSHEVTDGTSEVEAASDEIADAVDGISEMTADQREQLDTVAAEMSDLSATVEEVAATTDTVTETASEAADQTEAGREAAREAVDAIDSVERTTTEAVEEIQQLVEQMDAVGEVVDVIVDIAEQTNMLALNANIEAARVTEDGGGFGVVANEVKSLATETQERADEIEALLEDLRRQTDTAADRIADANAELGAGTATVERAEEALSAIERLVEETESGMRDIAVATDEQATSTEAVASRIDAVADAASETASHVEDVAASASEQNAAVGSVAESIEALRREAESLETAIEQYDVGDTGTAGVGARTHPATTDGGHEN